MNKEIIYDLKTICLDRFNLISTKSGLNNKEHKILFERCINGKDILSTALFLGMSESSVKKYYGNGVKKLEDCKKYLQLNSIKDIKEI